MHQTGTVTSSGIGSETYRCSASEVFTVTADDTIGIHVVFSIKLPSIRLNKNEKKFEHYSTLLFNC